MKSLGRWIVAVAAALSLVTCAAGCCLWTLGYVSVGDALERGTPSLARRLGLGGGIRGLHDPKAPAWDWLASALPLWAIVIVTGLLPLFVGKRLLSERRQRRLRREAGLCARCGYDLRATPGRCPECGAISARRKPDTGDPLPGQPRRR